MVGLTIIGPMALGGLAGLCRVSCDLEDFVGVGSAALRV